MNNINQIIQNKSSIYEELCNVFANYKYGGKQHNKKLKKHFGASLGIPFEEIIKINKKEIKSCCLTTDLPTTIEKILEKTKMVLNRIALTIPIYDPDTEIMEIMTMKYQDYLIKTTNRYWNIYEIKISPDMSFYHVNENTACNIVRVKVSKTKKIFHIFFDIDEVLREQIDPDKQSRNQTEIKNLFRYMHQISRN